MTDADEPGRRPGSEEELRVDLHVLFRFWSLLRQTYMLLLKSQERSLSAHSINFAQYMTLFLVRYARRPVTPGTVASYLAQETASVTYGLDRLEAKGLLHRVPAQGDRREVWLELTPKGREVLHHANNAAWEPLRQFSVVLTGNEQVMPLTDTLLALRNRGAELFGANLEALDFASEHLAPDPFMFGFWQAADAAGE